MKRSLLLILFCLSLYVHSFAQYGWNTLHAAPKAYRLDDCFFLNPEMGWAVVPNYFYPPGAGGQIWQTKNGGQTWIRKYTGASAFFRCIGFADSLNGWAGNLGPTATTDTIPLYQTHDGGASWTPVTLPSPQPLGICGISIASDSVIYAYGRYYGPPVLAKTTDKGHTWTTYDMSSYASVGLIEGHFWSKDTGFITGQDGANAVILHTVNGGVTWQTVYHASRNDSDHVWKLSFPSKDTGYGALECLSTQTRRFFIKTTDGGQTWTEKPFPAYYDEEGIGFITNNTGWIGGDQYAPTYKTTDGGNTWLPDYGFGSITPPFNSSGGFVINRFRRFGDTLMYASGNTMYKLTDVATGINEKKNTDLSFSNYPNPFKGQTTISYTLPKAYRNLRLSITDMNGAVIYSENIETQGVGQHFVSFNVDLPPGMYFYSLQTENFRMSSKMEVMK